MIRSHREGSSITPARRVPQFGSGAFIKNERKSPCFRWVVGANMASASQPLSTSLCALSLFLCHYRHFSSTSHPSHFLQVDGHFGILLNFRHPGVYSHLIYSTLFKLAIKCHWNIHIPPSSYLRFLKCFNHLKYAAFFLKGSFYASSNHGLFLP